MNSRSSINESNLVNFSADLSTLNQLDTKDGLLTFPFDHIYACHSESSGRRQTLQLDKEVEISTHCVVSNEKNLVVSSGAEITQKSCRVKVLQNENQKLKELLIYHLDLIQQQNERLTKKDKANQALKQENDNLKARLSRFERRAPHPRQPPPAVIEVPTPPVTSTVVKSEGHAQPAISFAELLLPESLPNPFVFDSDINKPNTFEVPKAPAGADIHYLPADVGIPSILDPTLNCDDFNMIESKHSFGKKEMKTENREALYTVTSNSGNPVIQRIQRSRRRSSTLGSLSRMSKSSTATKAETPGTSKTFDDKSLELNVNKKGAMMKYGRSTSTAASVGGMRGSLSERLQLIDTTPTGEDPYQLREADMRDQSPIPKLMLQKSTHTRIRLCTNTASATTPRRAYSPLADATPNNINKVKLGKYNLPNPYMHPTELKAEKSKTTIVHDPDLNLIKTEPEIDWRIYDPAPKPGTETSLCDFSYGESTNNLATSMLQSLDSVEFHDLFSSDSPLNLDNLTTETAFSPAPADKSALDKSKKRGARTTSLVGSNFMGEGYVEPKRSADSSKRGRKRALSTTGLLKNIKREGTQKGQIGAVAPKPKIIKGKAVCRGKKSPLPGMVTQKPYHTLVGDPDLSWYLGLDPDVKLEDVEPSGESAASTVEVPRWREKPYTSCYTLEGTENLDDKVFEKRHQKLEAEERRQLRWHMRRIREQRHVERLRQRQRDSSSWSGGGGASSSTGSEQPRPGRCVYTVWPHPQRDARYIEITDTLPVMAFGEIVPALPDNDFMLPWVRTSKALKRSKRSKTLH